MNDVDDDCVDDDDDDEIDHGVEDSVNSQKSHERNSLGTPPDTQ